LVSDPGEQVLGVAEEDGDGEDLEKRAAVLVTARR